MSLLQFLWGPIQVAPKSRGLRVFSALAKRLLHCIARYVPLLPSWRALIHRWRGVKAGRNVFIGAEVFIDDADQALVTIEDDVIVIARSVILGHAYYPVHFKHIFSDSRLHQGTVVRRGAYLGLQSIILPGVTVGEYSIVGAGSLVANDVPPYSLVIRVPARVVKRFGE